MMAPLRLRRVSFIIHFATHMVHFAMTWICKRRAPAEPFLDFTVALPAPAPGAEPRARSGIERDVIHDHVATFPWLADYLSEPQRRGRGGGGGGVASASGAEPRTLEEPDELTDEAWAAVWEEVRNKRDAWAEDDIGCDDFAMVIRGGRLDCPP